MRIGSDIQYCYRCRCEYALGLSACPICKERHSQSTIDLESSEKVAGALGLFVILLSLPVILGVSLLAISAFADHMQSVGWAYLPMVASVLWIGFVFRRPIAVYGILWRSRRR